MKHIQRWLAVIVFLICAPAFADDMNDPFQGVVAKYLAANPKPGLPEEARKFKVQAEFAVQEKQFDKAVELYGKALDIAPWWPEGHFNRALILGEAKKYWDAMREMKRYLLLVPDAPNARAAQDKIYQWEGVAGAEPKLTGYDLKSIPLEDAIILGSPAAEKKIIIFSDPDCLYCRKLHTELKEIIRKRKDIAFYIKLWPMTKLHPLAYEKSRSIQCKNSQKFMDDAFEGKEIPKTDCETLEIDNNIKLANELGLKGVPTIILPDGRGIPGYVNGDVLLNKLDNLE